MRAKTLGIVVLTACVLAAGRTTAMPDAQTPAAEPTPRPAQYLAAVMNRAAPAEAPPLPSPTPTISVTVGISGSVYLNPRWHVLKDGQQPIEYLVLLDVTGSMSWDFNGYGTYDGTNNGPGYTVPNTIRGDVQCESSSNPNPSNLPYTDRCLGGLNSAWKVINERRVYVLKQALVGLIERMNSADSMRLIAFSTAMTGTAEASNAWSSDKSVLTASVYLLGAYAADPYKTSGGASNAIALQKARDLLASAPALAPNGQPYKQVLIMLTDSVANVFLDGTLNTARDICPDLTEQQALQTPEPCQIGTTSDGKLRPISAMIDMANKIKAEHPNISIYAVGLAQVPDTGLPNIANDASYYFPATHPEFVSSILSSIQSRIVSSSCIAAGGNQWVDSIDAAHLPSPLPGPNDTVVGYTYIYQVNSGTPLFTLPIQRDPGTDKISFLLPAPDIAHPAAGIAPGTYEMMAYVGYKGDDQITRVYDWFSYFPASAPRLTFTIASDAQPGQIVTLDPLFLDLPPTVSLCP